MTEQLSALPINIVVRDCTNCAIKDECSFVNTGFRCTGHMPQEAYEAAMSEYEKEKADE